MLVGLATLVICVGLTISLIIAIVQKQRLRIEMQTIGSSVNDLYYNDPRGLIYEEILLAGGALNAAANAVLALALLFAATPAGVRRWLPMHRLFARGQLLLSGAALVLWGVLQFVTRTPMSAPLFVLIMVGCIVSSIYPIVLLRRLPTGDIHFSQETR